MKQAESHVIARRSVPVGVFSLVVAGILTLISGLWIRYGDFPGWLLPVTLALLEVGIAVIMLRPLRFRVVIGPAGIRTEGHAAWTLGPHEILGAGVHGGRHSTLWVEPTDQLARPERGFTEAYDAPSGAHLVPVAPAAVPDIRRALIELGFADGSARLGHPRHQVLTGRSTHVLGPQPWDPLGDEAARPRRARRAAPEEAGPEQATRVDQPATRANGAARGGQGTSVARRGSIQ